MAALGRRRIVSGAGGKAGDYGTEYDWMGFLYSINRATFLGSHATWAAHTPAHGQPGLP